MSTLDDSPASFHAEPETAASSPFSRDVGAVVLGGDYQGLAIARSVGRHGVPVVIVDDERSIGRLSRYCGTFESVPDLGDEAPDRRRPARASPAGAASRAGSSTPRATRRSRRWRATARC